MATQEVPVVLLTGATGRLGPLVAREIVRRGARLVLVARSESRLAQVGDAIRERSPGADIDMCVADFSQLSSVGHAGADLAASCARLDAVIHLAEGRDGVIGDGSATPETITVNYLAPWLLTDALLPLLVASSGCVITPGADPAGPLPPVVLPEALFGIQVTRVQTTHYRLSRVLGTMFSLELGRRHQDSGLSSISVVAPPDPGWPGAVLGMLDPRRWAARRDEDQAVPEALADLALGGTARAAAIGGQDPATGVDEESCRQLWQITDAVLAPYAFTTPPMVLAR